MITYRKTKKGEWVAYGPATTVRPGAVAVTKRDGTTKVEAVMRVGRPFTVDGAEMVYGYLDTHQRRTYTTRRTDSDGMCDECHARRGVVDAYDSSGIPGRVCHRCAAMSTYERSYA